MPSGALACLRWFVGWPGRRDLPKRRSLSLVWWRSLSIVLSSPMSPGTPGGAAGGALAYYERHRRLQPSGSDAVCALTPRASPGSCPLHSGGFRCPGPASDDVFLASGCPIGGGHFAPLVLSLGDWQGKVAGRSLRRVPPSHCTTVGRAMP